MNILLNLSIEAAIEIASSSSISPTTREAVEKELNKSGHSRKLFAAKMQKIKSLRLELSKHIS